MGAKVTVVEPDSVRALEALMHGYEVKTSLNAAKIADVIISVTGNLHALDKQHFDVMKDGVALANAGHFDVEINLEALKNESTKVERVREHVESYKYKDKEILVLAEGRLVNLAAATGHPASVMDMSFANQALASEWIKDNHKKLESKVYTLPKEVDIKIAATKLSLMGGELEILSDEQIKYLDSWEHGTSWNLNIFKKALTIGSGKLATELNAQIDSINSKEEEVTKLTDSEIKESFQKLKACLLYTSPSPRD